VKKVVEQRVDIKVTRLANKNQVYILCVYLNVKANFTLEQATKAQRWRYSSTLSLTSALDGVGGQDHASAALPPGKTRYPLYRTLGGPQGRSGRVQKISPPPGFNPRTVQSVASTYTD
jgi:hypothetical protein